VLLRSETGALLCRNLQSDARTMLRWYFLVCMGQEAGHLTLGASAFGLLTLCLNSGLRSRSAHAVGRDQASAKRLLRRSLSFLRISKVSSLHSRSFVLILFLVAANLKFC
jgi:6-phosphofructokinase